MTIIKNIINSAKLVFSFVRRFLKFSIKIFLISFFLLCCIICFKLFYGNKLDKNTLEFYKALDSAKKMNKEEFMLKDVNFIFEKNFVWSKFCYASEYIGLIESFFGKGTSDENLEIINFLIKKRIKTIFRDSYYVKNYDDGFGNAILLSNDNEIKSITPIPPANIIHNNKKYPFGCCDKNVKVKIHKNYKDGRNFSLICN